MDVDAFCKQKLVELARKAAIENFQAGLRDLIADGDPTHRMQLSQGVCPAPMSASLRDAALQYVDTEQTFLDIDTRHVLALGRTPLASVTKSQAYKSILATAVQHGNAKTQTTDSVLLELRGSTTLPTWSPQVEREFVSWKDAGGALDSLTAEQSILMLTNQSWRMSAGYTDQTLGATFQLQEALRSRGKERSAKFSKSQISNWGGLDLCSLVLETEQGWTLLDGGRIEFCSSVSAPPKLSRCVFLPAHPSFAELKAETIVLWHQDEATARWKPLQAISHEIVDPDIVDAVVMPSGTVAVTIGRRNAYTGGYEESETMLLRYNGKQFADATASEKDVQNAEDIEEKRAKGEGIDFRDHGSLLSVHTKAADGVSLVCFGDIVLDEFPGIAVAALGCPQDYYVVFADGRVIRMTDGFEKTVESRDNLGAFFGAAIASGINS